MDIFFNQKQQIVVNNSIENVRDNIQGITSQKWYKLSPHNITGRRKSNGDYSFTHQFSLVAFQWIEGSPAYLNVRLEKEDNRTKIQTRIRPNSVFVIFFYLQGLLFLLEIFGVRTIDSGSKALNLFLYLSFALIIFGLIKLFTTSLKNKFLKIIG